MKTIEERFWNKVNKEGQMSEEQELVEYLRTNWFNGKSAEVMVHIFDILRAKDERITELEIDNEYIIKDAIGLNAKLAEMQRKLTAMENAMRNLNNLMYYDSDLSGSK